MAVFLGVDLTNLSDARLTNSSGAEVESPSDFGAVCGDGRHMRGGELLRRLAHRGSRDHLVYGADRMLSL
eukprot:3364513-Pleurochrysis_carterae.AAC.1